MYSPNYGSQRVPYRYFRHYLPVPGSGNLRACSLSLDGVAVSQAPSPGIKTLFPPSPVTTMVAQNLPSTFEKADI
ncbi:hypothetical protein JTE90_008553 [Oedothorax gibbosus]|uniref:Uncharacterized protein n=1 Tax=Oedothorax gibbosus TaxID=931172 RepID=A0AAV6TCP4_9ARAC|nr:hypothetical protein JTE90_008553 [Oedothorax gibbosus]